MHGAQVWIHQPLPSRFLLFEFCQEIENQVKSYNPPNAGLLISREAKWLSLQLISPDCYKGRCQLRSQNCRECHIQLKTEIAEQTFVKKNISTRKQFFWIWFTTCCIWTSSHICDSQKCCVKKMGCNILNFKALTRLTTNIQLVNEEEFCLQILKALWNEIRFKSLDILRYFSIISLWCGIGISYPVVICICIWPQQSTNNAAAYYLPLGHQTVRALPEKTATHKSWETTRTIWRGQ